MELISYAQQAQAILNNKIYAITVGTPYTNKDFPKGRIVGMMNLISTVDARLVWSAEVAPWNRRGGDSSRGRFSGVLEGLAYGTLKDQPRRMVQWFAAGGRRARHYQKLAKLEADVNTKHVIPFIPWFDYLGPKDIDTLARRMSERYERKTLSPEATKVAERALLDNDVSSSAFVRQ